MELYLIEGRSLEALLIRAYNGEDPLQLMAEIYHESSHQTIQGEDNGNDI